MTYKWVKQSSQGTFVLKSQWLDIYANRCTVPLVTTYYNGASWVSENITWCIRSDLKLERFRNGASNGDVADCGDYRVTGNGSLDPSMTYCYNPLGKRIFPLQSGLILDGNFIPWSI